MVKEARMQLTVTERRITSGRRGDGDEEDDTKQGVFKKQRLTGGSAAIAATGLVVAGLVMARLLRPRVRGRLRLGGCVTLCCGAP
jgi:hypothetical protein